MDMRDDSTASDRCLDQSVEFFVASHGQLQMSWRDPLHLQVFARVACQLEHLCREVLKNCRTVNGRSGAHTILRAESQLQEPVDSSHRELAAL